MGVGVKSEDLNLKFAITKFYNFWKKINLYKLKSCRIGLGPSSVAPHNRHMKIFALKRLKQIRNNSCPVNGQQTILYKCHITMAKANTLYAQTECAVGRHTHCLSNLSDPKAIICFRYSYCFQMTFDLLADIRHWTRYLE